MSFALFSWINKVKNTYLHILRIQILVANAIWIDAWIVKLFNKHCCSCSISIEDFCAQVTLSQEHYLWNLHQSYLDLYKVSKLRSFRGIRSINLHRGFPRGPYQGSWGWPWTPPDISFVLRGPFECTSYKVLVIQHRTPNLKEKLPPECQWRHHKV